MAIKMQISWHEEDQITERRRHPEIRPETDPETRPRDPVNPEIREDQITKTADQDDAEITR